MWWGRGEQEEEKEVVEREVVERERKEKKENERKKKEAGGEGSRCERFRKASPLGSLATLGDQFDAAAVRLLAFSLRAKRRRERSMESIDDNDDDDDDERRR